MKTCRSLAIIALLALPLAGVASAQNLLVNGDFETGDFTGWQLFNETANATITNVTPGNGPSFPGERHAYLNNQDDNAIALTLKQQTAPGSGTGGGTAYYFLDMLVEEAVAGGVIFVEIFAEDINEDTGEPFVIASTILATITGPVGEWQQVQGTWAAPPETDFLTIQVNAATGAVVGSVCRVRVDNFYLSLTSPPVSTEDMSMGSIKALFR